MIGATGPFVIVWRYEVADANREAFERVYGRDGDWGRLFATAEGFIETELLAGDDGSYITLDRWRSGPDFETFKAAAGEAYRALDEQCAALTVREQRIGAFNVAV